MSTRIQLRRDTAVRWASVNPVLAAGEPAVESDTGKLKVGDGITAWSSLPYILDVSDLTPVIQELVAAAAPPGVTDEHIRDVVGATLVGDGDFIVAVADDQANVLRLHPGVALTELADALPGKQDKVTLGADVAAVVDAGTGPLLQSLRASFASRNRNLLASFATPDTGDPPVSTDLPTVTWASAKSLERWVNPLSSEFRIRGDQGTWDPSLLKLALAGQYSALDFYLTGTEVEIGLVEQVDNGSLVWVLVDGKPITSGPTLGMTTSPGGQFWIKLAWSGGAKRRRITVHTSSANAWQGVAVDMTASLTPGPVLPRVAFIGDSFFNGSGAASLMESAAFLMGLMLGVDAEVAAVGGTGYAVGGADTFGSVNRVAKVTQRAPELLVFSGSVNDPPEGLQAAAAACFAAYQEALPGVPAIVFGPQPSAASATVSANRAAAIAAVKAAALAAPNVIAFYDMVGTGSGTVPPAFSGFTTYNPGDLVTYAGSVWRWSSTVAGSSGPYYPGIDGYYWAPVTYAYTGTGQVGATTGDGNRDVFLYSDGIHPTVEGSLAFATRQASEIRSALAAS